PYGRDGLPAAGLVGAVEAPGRPDISLSSSWTELDRSDAWCVFALTSADPTGGTSMSIQPRQVFAALELDPPGLGEPSTEPVLLRFVRPLDGSYRPETVVAELLTADLPMPLREHPAPPSVSVMTATPSFPGPGLPTLAEAAQWTSGLSYTHQHAAQDVITVSWAEPIPPVAATGGSTALAEALAGYATAAPELAGLIGWDAQPPDGVDAATTREAAVSLAELAATVATAWSQHWAERDSAAPSDAAPAGGYRLRATYATQPDNRRLLDRLVVHRASAEYGWPVISLESADRQATLTPGPVAGQTREYVANQPVPAGSLAVRLEWPGLRGAPHPAARISLTAERNAVLPAGAPISPAFLLISEAHQTDVAAPAVRWNEELPLTGAAIAEALQNAFDALVGEEPEDIRLSIEVGYAEPLGELRTVLPVLLIPELEPVPNSAEAIAAQLAEWQRAAQPATAGAQWRVSLAVLSAHADQPPILAFDQLVFPVPS
ncbi:MAG: hypothetical protein QOE53_1717, partial [Pseudonocardiales bacterium]|nr:hypothetical protein [Pseudonocardiales bacterium]